MGRFSFHMITSTGFGCVTMFISIRQSLQISEKTGEFFFILHFTELARWKGTVRYLWISSSSR